MPISHLPRAFLGLVTKDLRIELRLRRAWPAMLLFGLILILLMETQVDLPAGEKRVVVSGLLWLDVFFAGLLALERSFAGEREDGCWAALMLYPVPPAAHFLAKVAVNVIALVLLESVLIPAFVVFSGVPLLQQPLPIMAIALLANLGFASVGVLVSALTTGLAQRGSLLALLLFPLLTPVIVGATGATRLLATVELGGEGWRWMQLLAVFALSYTALGAIIFEFVIED